jgi:hypothetical protein
MSIHHGSLLLPITNSHLDRLCSPWPKTVLQVFLAYTTAKRPASPNCGKPSALLAQKKEAGYQKGLSLLGLLQPFNITPIFGLCKPLSGLFASVW